MISVRQTGNRDIWKGGFHGGGLLDSSLGTSFIWYTKRRLLGLMWRATLWEDVLLPPPAYCVGRRDCFLLSQYHCTFCNLVSFVVVVCWYG